MHILLLTRLDDLQAQRIRDVAAAEGRVLISRDQTAAGESGVPVTAIIGGPPPELTAHMHQLEWVQLRTDCLEGWEECLNDLHERGVLVTRTRGSYNDTVPDHAMMLVLALARDLPRLLQQRRAHQWKGDPIEPLVLSQATLGLVGMGTIGA
ncbi:MAG: hypothetical protein HUU35_19645, partial [Armatimonadetes bacterium]|nr:hypothetical protein [Armatimonadota bacterium]